MQKVILIKLMFLIVFFNGIAIVYAKRTVPMEGLVNPTKLIVDQENKELFITDGINVYIYCLTDLHLKKKFGQEGEGPREFLGTVDIHLKTDEILVNSKNKLSFFNRDGTFIKERKVVSGKLFMPLGEKQYVGHSWAINKGIIYETITIYNTQLEKVQELSRRKSPIQESGDIKIMSAPQFFYTYKNKIYYLNKKEFEINVANDKGKILFTINREYKLREFNNEDRVRFKEHFKSMRYYSFLKDRIVYPTDYPAVRQLRVSEEKVLVLTHKKINGKLSELFIYDTKGKFLKKTYLPLKEKNALSSFPYAISKGKMYQLVEGSDDEYELEITDIQ